MYVSGSLQRHPAEYPRRLSIIRADANRLAWIAFFVEPVEWQVRDAERSVIELVTLVGRRSTSDACDAGVEPRKPLPPREVSDDGVTYPSSQQVGRRLATICLKAPAAAGVLQDLAIAAETTGQMTNRSFSNHGPYRSADSWTVP